MKHSQEVAGGLVVARGQTTKLLEAVEEALDFVAVPIRGAVNCALDEAVFLAGNDHCRAKFLYQRHHAVDIIGFVADAAFFRPPAAWARARTTVESGMTQSTSGACPASNKPFYTLVCAQRRQCLRGVALGARGRQRLPRGPVAGNLKYRVQKQVVIPRCATHVPGFAC